MATEETGVKRSLETAEHHYQTNALDCYQCHNVRNTSDCHTDRLCLNNQICYTDATVVGDGIVFNLGCKPQQDCTRIPTHHPDMSIVGRALVTPPVVTLPVGAPAGLPDHADCSQCCHSNHCNRYLCPGGTADPPGRGACADNPDYNCQLFVGAFNNICGDVHHAKTVCRKYCNLCDLVDGGWAGWSSWGSCDVTCNTGTVPRSRACTAPAPMHHGLPCVGDRMEYKNCTRDDCPVHGGWSLWSEWSNCSVPCGVGMNRRYRHCSSPYPGPDGNPCDGEPINYRICLAGACHDGGWSDWAPWTVCSATCGVGLHNRNRTCSSPAPSLSGKMCPGLPVETVICSNHSCPTVMSAFSVYGSATMPSSSNIKFTNVVYNQGNDYSTATGHFTCRHPGLYAFILDLSSYNAGAGSGYYSAWCYLNRNSSAITSEYQRSPSVIVHLDVGDTVYPTGCSIGTYAYGHGTFMGFLISAE